MTKENIDYSKIEFASIGGNPPYEMRIDGTSAVPIYQEFIRDAINNSSADIITFIIPARWFSGGKGADLKAFRKEMMNDRRIKKLVDFENYKDCFPNFDGSIEGGICYFVWDKNYNGPCEVVNRSEKTILSKQKRFLNEFNDIIVRSNVGISVIHKVQALNELSFSTVVSPQTPFGMHSNFANFSLTEKKGYVKLYANKTIGWVDSKYITKNGPLINKYKVLISEAYGQGLKEQKQVLNKPIIAEQNSACTQTYLVAGTWNTLAEAENVKTYMQTKFFRYMVSLLKISQHNGAATFNFVPLVPFDRQWTDAELYKRYSLSVEEIAVIENKIREMSND